MSKLLPCPFCGGEAKLYTDGVTLIICKECSISVSNQERSIIKLTDQWNHRYDIMCAYPECECSIKCNNN